jgi:hypothetical protein
MPHDYAAIQESREDALLAAFIATEFRIANSEAQAQTQRNSGMDQDGPDDGAVHLP